MDTRPASLMFAHALEFTTDEVRFLTVWNEMQDKGFKADAKAFVQIGLQLEHYRSKLDEDHTQRSEEQVVLLQQLELQFETALIQACRLAGLDIVTLLPLSQPTTNPVVTEIVNWNRG